MNFLNLRNLKFRLNLSPSDSIFGTDQVKGPLLTIITVLVAFVRIITQVLGTLSLLLIDVILGGATYSLILQNGLEFNVLVTTIKWSAGFVGMSISLATSAIQLAFWDQLLTDKGQTPGSGKVNWFVLIGLVLFITLDTVVDISSMTYLIYGESPMHIWPSKPEPLYFVAMALVGFMTSANEFFMARILKHLRS